MPRVGRRLYFVAQSKDDNEHLPILDSGREPDDTILRLALAAHLARAKGQSRDHVFSDLRSFLTWYQQRHLAPLACHYATSRSPHATQTDEPRCATTELAGIWTGTELHPGRLHGLRDLKLLGASRFVGSPGGMVRVSPGHCVTGRCPGVPMNER
jgi:hypothetical protein